MFGVYDGVFFVFLFFGVRIFINSTDLNRSQVQKLQISNIVVQLLVHANLVCLLCGLNYIFNHCFTPISYSNYAFSTCL